MFSTIDIISFSILAAKIWISWSPFETSSSVGINLDNTVLDVYDLIKQVIKTKTAMLNDVAYIVLEHPVGTEIASNMLLGDITVDTSTNPIFVRMLTTGIYRNIKL